MRQVKLKIEEFSDLVVVTEDKHNLGVKDSYNHNFLTQVFNVIRDKCSYGVLDYGNLFISVLKPGESRESIIEALGKYQESILPVGYYFSINHVSTVCIIRNKEDEKVSVFKDDTKRIITITDFEEDE